MAIAKENLITHVFYWYSVVFFCSCLVCHPFICYAYVFYTI